MLQWILKSERYPDNPVPVANEAEAKQLIKQYQEITRGHKARVKWEYGTYDPDVKDSYRRVGPR